MARMKYQRRRGSGGRASCAAFEKREAMGREADASSAPSSSSAPSGGTGGVGNGTPAPPKAGERVPYERGAMGDAAEETVAVGEGVEVAGHGYVERDGARGGDGQVREGTSVSEAEAREVWYGGGETAEEGEGAGERRLVYTPGRSVQILLGASRSSKNFKCIRGPVGNGKSVGCCWYIYLCGKRQVAQWVVLKDGTRRAVRWSKFLIARHTFKALDETTVETWNEWFGDRTRWTANPYQGRFEEEQADGTLVRIDFVCYATESRNIMNDLQSLELSGAWINEAVQTPYAVVGRVFTRLKRFNPVPRNHAPMLSFGVVMDTNSPDETNWWYRKEQVEKPEDWLFIISPPAVLVEKDAQTGRTRYVPNDLAHCHLRGSKASAAENVKQIDGGFHDGMSYWMDMLNVLDDEEIGKLLMNRYGTSVAGMPVFPEWNDGVHCVKGEMKWERGMTLVAGMDLGRRPAFVVGQMGRDGVLRVMRECTTWDRRMGGGRGGLQSMDVVQFFEERVRPMLVNEFGWPHARMVVFADPAGKNFTETSSISAIDLLRAAGMDVYATDKIVSTASDVRDIANANDVDVRLRCVSQALRTMRYGVPELQVSERCEMLRKAMNGAYCFRKMRALAGDGAERYEDKPDKGDYSHIADALQYLCLGVFRGAADYSKPASEAFEDMRMDMSAATVDLGLV